MFSKYTIEWWVSAWLLYLALSLSVVMLVRDIRNSRARYDIKTIKQHQERRKIYEQPTTKPTPISKRRDVSNP